MQFDDLSNVPYATSCEWTMTRIPHTMCGKNPLSKKSYCEEHYKRVYITPTDDKEIEEYLEADIKGCVVIDSDDII